MKTISWKLIGGFFLVCMYSCQKPETTTGGIIHLELSDIPESNSFYEASRMVPLETTADNLLGEYLIVKTQGNYIFVFDENVRDGIHRFDSEGKYHGKTVEVGEGPGMVRNILDFVPTDTGLEVLVGMGEFSKIIVFDQDFQLDKEVGLDYLGSSFEKFPSGGYVISGSYNLPLVAHRLVSLDAAGQRLQEFLPNDYSNQMMPMQERNFHKADGKVFFHEVFNPIAYEVREDSLEAKFQFDFGRYSIPTKFWEVDIMQGFEMINQNGFATVYSYWENDSKAFFEIYVQADGTTNNQIVWDKKNKKATQRITSKEQDPTFYNPIGMMDGSLVFLAQAAYVLDNEAGISVEGINKDDNPVLLFVDLK
jgi:hypothetical protein